ncbi:MAG: fatty acid desaturase, partial [Deltaproteobacteria bacterium]|nr:fatty acid desaturase [Deltaproteobacteria bacterium]
FLLVDIFLGLLAGPFIYGRIFWVKHSPLTDPALRRRIAWQYVLIVAFWSGLIASVAYFGWWREFTLAYLIPAYITGIVQTLRKLTEHLGLPAGDAMNGARTIISHQPLAKFASWTAFHIEAHGLHHKYPQMPHTNLERVLEVDGIGAQDRVYRSYWAAVRDMLPHMLRPGVGANVTSPAATSVG